MSPSKKLTLLIILLAVLTTSCWNSRELPDLAIVTGVGIDVGQEPGTISFTNQVIKPAKMKTGAEKSSEPMPYFNVTSTGRTIFEAIRKSARLIDRRLYFPHSQVIIFSEELARKGVAQYLDLMVRDPEFRRDNFVVVSKGTAAGVLQAKTEIGDVPGSNISHLIKRRVSASLATGVTLLEFMQRSMSKTTAPIASLVEINADGKTLKLSGTSVFKQDKLVGYLNETETRGLLWILGKVQAGIIIVKCPGNEGNVSLEVVSASGKISPQKKEDKLQIAIKIAIQVHLAEQSCAEDLTKPEKIAFLKKELEGVVKEEITAALSKARELKSDIFAFGDEIHKKQPQLWRELEPNWNEVFSQLEVAITIESKLTRSGMTTKPARPEK